MDMRRFLVVGLLICSFTYHGCASKSGKKSLVQSSKPGLAASSTAAPFGNAKYRDLVEELEANNGTWPSSSRSRSTFGKITASVKTATQKATTAVSSALTPESKVVKAPDPISLASMPEQINADVFYQAGRLAESKGNMGAAIEQYTQALATNPEHTPSLISLARLHDRVQDFAKAQRFYRRAIEASPENVVPYNDLGLCLARNGHRQESITVLRQAVALQPDRKLYRNNLATVLVTTGQIDEAWQQLREIHSPAEAHYNLGYLLSKKGHKDEAHRHLTLAIQKDPSLTDAQNLLAQLRGNSPTSPTASTASEPAGTAVDRVASRRTQPTSSSRSTKVSPASMVRSRRSIRRIPPSDDDSASGEPPHPPRVQLHTPVPPAPQSQHTPAKAPAAPLQPQSKMQFPTQTISEPRAELGESVEETELPTPSLLNDIAQR